MKLSKNIISIILFTLFSCLFLNTAKAQNHNPSNLIIIINVKSQMQIGDNLEFSYTMISPTDLSLKFTPHIKCFGNAPEAMVELKEADITANTPFEGKYYSMLIEDFMEPQKCVAGIKITEPFKKTKEISFHIATNPTIEAEILFCQDKKCEQKSRVYQTGETLYINHKTEISGIKSEATITAPDSSKENIILPGDYIFKKKGIYNISVVSKADNHKDNIQDFKITVLAGEIKVNDQRICKIDGICSGQENEQNCPQDCLDSKAQPQMSTVISTRIIVLLFLALVIIIAMIASYFYFIKPKNNSIE
ncbi:MAG: hypothetical protein U9Q85_01480 [Patescibacteria group bacterium]|nr:hypothetical protein [Patescibacteria group bacterium]